jgi:hypothetical protein
MSRAHLVGTIIYQCKGEGERVGENADGIEYLCHLETKSWEVVIFSALGVVH